MENIIKHFLMVKLYISNSYSKVSDYFMKVKEVSIVDGNKRKSVYVKYLMYCYCNYIISLLLKIRKYFDVKNKLVQVSTKTNYGNQLCILSNDAINFEYVDDQVSNVDMVQSMGNIIYRKFRIHDDTIDLCFKDYLVKYKDCSKRYDNTVGNILLFNNVSIMGNPDVDIVYRNDSGSHTVNCLYADIRDLHIADIIKG